MGKGGRKQKDTQTPKRRKRDDEFVEEEDMDDEIDYFHKQRDIMPLDADEDVGTSYEDGELPVLDFEGGDGDEDDDARLTGFAARASEVACKAWCLQLMWFCKTCEVFKCCAAVKLQDNKNTYDKRLVEWMMKWMMMLKRRKKGGQYGAEGRTYIMVLIMLIMRYNQVTRILQRRRQRC